MSLRPVEVVPLEGGVLLGVSRWVGSFMGAFPPGEGDADGEGAGDGEALGFFSLSSAMARHDAGVGEEGSGRGLVRRERRG